MARILSGQKTIATVGTALALGAGIVDGALAVKALATNTGVMVVGNDGADDVTASNGYELSAKEEVIFEDVASLDDIIVDTSVNGEGVAWLIINTRRQLNA
jgi:hypothetical protein